MYIADRVQNEAVVRITEAPVAVTEIHRGINNTTSNAPNVISDNRNFTTYNQNIPLNYQRNTEANQMGIGEVNIYGTLSSVGPPPSYHSNYAPYRVPSRRLHEFPPSYEAHEF